MKFTKIKSIKRVGSEDVYHMTVQKNHNFFGNNLCLHNCGYRGEVMIILLNTGKSPFSIKTGDRIAQGVVNKLPTVSIREVEDLDETERGAGGFGSTGRR